MSEPILAQDENQTATMETTGPTGEPHQSSTWWMHGFLGRYFLTMPKPVQVLSYLLILVALLHNYLKPTSLEGRLWLERTQDGKRESIAAEGYSIQAGDFSFVANSQGYWMIRTPRKLPGSLRADLIDPDGRRVGEVQLPMPLPVVSHFFDESITIYHDVDDGTARLASTLRMPNFDWPYTAYADPVGDGPVDGKESSQASFAELRGEYRLSITRIWARESGDSTDSVGSVYFRVFVDNQEIETPGLPQKRYSNTYLPLQDNVQILPKNLSFGVPVAAAGRTRSVRVSIYEYDRTILFMKQSDDLIGSFQFSVGPDTVGSTLELESARLPREWPNNSEISVTVEPEDQASAWDKVARK